MIKTQRDIVLLLSVAIVCTLAACRGDAPCGGAECTKTTLTYLQDGDCELEADIFLPPADEATPAILWIHPGGMITGERKWIDSHQLAKYLEAGYTVVAIDYRLAPEFALETIVSDIETAYTWLIQEGPELFNIDPERVGVVGHSAGGYLALLTGYRVEPRPNALIVFYGYGDLTGEWAVQPSDSHNHSEIIMQTRADEVFQRSQGNCVPTGSELDGRFNYYEYLRQQGTWPQEVSGHDPVVEASWFGEYEPVQNVTAEYPPTMLLHGRIDNDVPFSVAERMANALKQSGVAMEFITGADWNHVFDQEQAGSPEVEAALKQVLLFLDAHVK